MLFSLRVISLTKDFGLTFEARLLFVALMLMSKARLFFFFCRSVYEGILASICSKIEPQVKTAFVFNPHFSIPLFLVQTTLLAGNFVRNLWQISARAADSTL